jgi:hypothetical protein
LVFARKALRGGCHAHGIDVGQARYAAGAVTIVGERENTTGVSSTRSLQLT